MSKKTNRKMQAETTEEVINIETGMIETPATRTIVDDIREQRLLAATDLNEIPANARAAFSIAKGNAVDTLAALEAQYAEFVLDKALYLFLDGKPESVTAFATMAKEMGPCAVLDCNELYQRLAEGVAASMPLNPKTFDTTQYVRLIEALSLLGKELGIGSMPRPGFQSVTFAADEEIGPFVRGLVEQTFGTELSVMVMRKSLHKQAIDIGFNDAVPAVVIGALNVPDLKQNLLRNPARAMTLVVEDEVTEEAVEAALGQLVRLAVG